MLKLGILVSGGGSNLQAIIDGINNGTITNTSIATVVSSNATTYALERAKQNNIDATVISKKSRRRKVKRNRIFRRLDRSI